MGDNIEHPSVTTFREYLRIKTVQPDPDYDTAVTFLKRVCEEIGLEFNCIDKDPKKPIVVLKWKGSDSSLSSLLLNSHVDVVPVFSEFWKYDPFSAHKDKEGNIYGRGSQDMKCVGIQYLEAIRRLKDNGFVPKRNVYLSFVPDEEITGYGMKELIVSSLFKEMNIGYALDEGLASPNDVFPVYYGEKLPWWMKFTFKGSPGHGSQFIKNTAVEKMSKMLNRLLEFRNSEEMRMAGDKTLDLGDVTTCNITMFEGGVQCNVLPADLSFCADFRISPLVDLEEFEKTIRGWMAEAGNDVSLTFIQRISDKTLSPITMDDPWWNGFQTACKKLGLETQPKIFPAATDSRFLREQGIPCVGFSPMNNTPVLLHDHNEYLNENVFLRGIEAYCEIIPGLANSTAA